MDHREAGGEERVSNTDHPAQPAGDELEELCCVVEFHAYERRPIGVCAIEHPSLLSGLADSEFTSYLCLLLVRPVHD